MTGGEGQSNRLPADTSSLFDELKDAHEGLLSAIDELDRLTSGPLPSRELLDSVRWRLSKASLCRRMLWGKVHLGLAQTIDESAKARLRDLQEVDIRLLRDSTRHVAKWSTEAIVDDWKGYCRASEQMRSKMLEAIAGEKRTLYPLLGG